ncbi:carboxymuconolactone decarboxylase family protein [Photobacterium sp. DNB23_23_1]|uniref:Carboxymuconolactone decarboxylase family protein n=1 Tax=Photobacterium pectinilyticum TaxID=2906793 RepID=A0ABT1N157_9GAMM|nr:carboxymuconolactone decarboxylase family protein [Photobacterium sp. ZSDE20]MCQ1058470.1 carboxymuconolactone decarboxylase family protein [Photobacterium sp. ZSDE20]MDD1823193.1 carboxymuconolactone decarboxylase family protein [Photobacterium sp. ZSDE20]
MRISAKENYSLFIKPLLWLQKRHYGKILNPAKLWGRRPTLFWLVAGFFGYLDRRSSPLSPVVRSLVCVQVSQLNDCAFCVDANGMKLAERCDSVEKIKALANWQDSDLFDAQERAVLNYTEAMTITGQRVTDEMLTTLKQWLDEDAIVDLTALIAFQNLSAKFNTALDVPQQGFCSLPIQPSEQKPTDAPTQTDK